MTTSSRNRSRPTISPSSSSCAARHKPSTSKAVEYEIAQQEATQSSNLYQNLLQRMKEADLVAGLHSSNITLVDQGRVRRPSLPAQHPRSPSQAASPPGLILGICAALLREATDERIQNLDEFRNSGPEMPLAFLPYHASGSRKRLAASRAPAPSHLPARAPGQHAFDSIAAQLPARFAAQRHDRCFRAARRLHRGAAQPPHHPDAARLPRRPPAPGHGHHQLRPPAKARAC